MLVKAQSFLLLSFILLVVSCSDSETKKGKALYEVQCASCHLLPEINDLPKNLWRDKVLPEMGARMGIRDSTYDPYQGYGFDEQHAMRQAGVFSVSPSMSRPEWQMLTDYVLANAPDSLSNEGSTKKSKTLSQFSLRPVNIDSTDGSLISYAGYNPTNKELILGDVRGNIFEYGGQDTSLKRKVGVGEALTSVCTTDSTVYATTTGVLNPSEIPKGRIYRIQSKKITPLPFSLHRPVHTLVKDFDENGRAEILVSEFGNLTGQLSMFVQKRDSSFEKKILLGRPGTIRTVASDMNHDGRVDIVALTSQGEEGISIFYQTDDLSFRHRQVIRFSPVYGSSWFELLDYDGDGDQDIITVHGDNGDKTPILKPYHGMRIHLNDGTDQFSEVFFYPFHGATRSVSRDFDEDGDIDIALVSTFPDYGRRPEKSFVYLENKNGFDFSFDPYGLPEDFSGRWFLMDAGDVDADGDEDIVLTCFTFSFTPLPKDLSKKWNESNFDMVILKNGLRN